MFQQFADQEPKDKKVIQEGEMSEEEFFEPADSDDDSNRFNFKSLVPEYMNDPKFHVGQIFQSIDQLRKAIREHSCKHRKNIKLPKNDKIRLAKCEKGCPWEFDGVEPHARWEPQVEGTIQCGSNFPRLRNQGYQSSRTLKTLSRLLVVWCFNRRGPAHTKNSLLLPTF